MQVRDNATLVLSKVLHARSFHQHPDNHEERKHSPARVRTYVPQVRIAVENVVLPATGNALLEDDNTFHLVRAADELDEVKSKRGSVKDKTKAITEIYLTRLLSVKVRRPQSSPAGTGEGQL